VSSSKPDGDDAGNGEEPRVVVRDRRRIDPETGEIRPPAPETGLGAAEPDLASVPEEAVIEAVPSQEAELKAQLDERTADLQRLQAEYANYRKRVDRDREVVVNTAKASVATELLSVLDDIDRAAQHGDLTGAFKAVADKLGATLERTGLEAFGHEGEEFDPAVHEAVQHDTSPDVTGPTVTAVLRRGYRFGDRVVRAALVAVTDHEPAPVVVEEAADEEPSMPSKDWYDPNNPDGAADKD
jgi:molecular chaperone GrpE